MLIISVTDFSYSSPITRLLSPTAPLDVDVSVDKGVVAVFVVDGVVVGGGLAGGAAVVVVVVVVAGVIGGAATTGAGACDVVAPAVTVLGFL